MNPTVRNGVSTTLDIFLGFAVICVLPFAWLLRDGLGPGSVPTTGWAAAAKAFMSFYTGPAILLLAVFKLALRKVVPTGDSPPPISGRNNLTIAFAAIAFLSVVMVWILMT